MRTFTEKLLAYAIGRGIEYLDLPAVRQNRPRRGAERLSLVVDHLGIVKQHAVQDEHRAVRVERPVELAQCGLEQ